MFPAVVGGLCGNPGGINLWRLNIKVGLDGRGAWKYYFLVILQYYKVINLHSRKDQTHFIRLMIIRQIIIIKNPYFKNRVERTNR